jgi:hypothetical protein
VTQARVQWLTIGGDRTAWRDVGFTVGDDGLIPLFGTSLRINPDLPAEGITGWSLSGIDSEIDDIDGLPTAVVGGTQPTFADHDIGAIGLDHVVVLTSEIERTAGAIERSTGCELKRIREVGTMRQGFHRIGGGGLIVELVERPEVTEGTASFWGVVVNVDDIDAACELLGPDRIGAPKDAVQPGRRIATVRADVGLGLPVALMTP